MAFANRDSPEFKDYGTASMRVLANNYYHESECKAQETDELLSEWNKFKFDMLKWKSEKPDPSVFAEHPTGLDLAETP